MNISRATIFMSNVRSKNSGTLSISLMKEMPIVRWKMIKLITLRKPSRVSETIKSEWKKKRSDKPRASSNGKVEQITLNKKEISFNNRSWKLKDKTNCSNLLLLVSKLKLRNNQHHQDWCKVKKCKCLEIHSWRKVPNQFTWLMNRKNQKIPTILHMGLVTYKTVKLIHKLKPVILEPRLLYLLLVKALLTSTVCWLRTCLVEHRLGVHKAGIDIFQLRI